MLVILSIADTRSHKKRSALHHTYDSLIPASIYLDGTILMIRPANSLKFCV